MGNGHLNCQGILKRKHVLTQRTEESSIDNFISSTELAKNVTGMIIDVDQKNTLTRITKTKAGVVIKK